MFFVCIYSQVTKRIGKTQVLKIREFETFSETVRVAKRSLVRQSHRSTLNEKKKCEKYIQIRTIFTKSNSSLILPSRKTFASGSWP